MVFMLFPSPTLSPKGEGHRGFAWENIVDKRMGVAIR
jgi:hypothetical protein